MIACSSWYGRTYRLSASPARTFWSERRDGLAISARRFWAPTRFGMQKSCTFAVEPDWPLNGAIGMRRSNMEASASDHALVTDCLHGKDEAWTVLLGRYKNLIFSIPIKLGFSP